MDDMVLAMLQEGEGDARCTLLQLRNGNTLSISRSLLRYARDRAALADPLGNGVRGVLAIPEALAPRWQDGYVQEVAGGAVLLHGGTVVLFKPFSIELYASGMDALHARHCHGRIDLGS